MYVAHPVPSEDRAVILNLLNQLVERGWTPSIDSGNQIRLTKFGVTGEFCPLTALAFQYGHGRLRVENAQDAGLHLGLSKVSALGVIDVSDLGATIDDHGPRFCAGWGYSKTLRYQMEDALGLLPWYSLWRRLRLMLAK